MQDLSHLLPVCVQTQVGDAKIQMHDITAFDDSALGGNCQEAAGSVIFLCSTLHTEVRLKPRADAILPELVIEPASHVADGRLARMDYLIRQCPASENVGQLHHGCVGVKHFRDARVEIFFDQIYRRDKVPGAASAPIFWARKS